MAQLATQYELWDNDTFPTTDLGEVDVTPIEHATEIAKLLKNMSLKRRVAALNAVREIIHSASPFADNPVDFVRWIAADSVTANDYNPNSVAPPEMTLLEHSIREDGYTQPIVSWCRNDDYEVIDGFHRHRVGKESKEVAKRIKGYLPLVVINADREDRSDRIASTIRHNRARGKHRVDGMSDIVVELKRRNWSDERIARELGMDQDEILRLCQITGLSELFSDQEFSKSWDVEGDITEDDFKELSDDVSTYGDEASLFRTVNTSDEDRIFHTFDKWECHKAGFYNKSMPGMTKEQCEETYRQVLSDIPLFTEVLGKIIEEWKYSCEHYLTNTSMNRIAWLGQAAVCHNTGVPSAFRNGFYLLTKKQQDKADSVALKSLNEWLTTHDFPAVTMEEAKPSRQSDIY